MAGLAHRLSASVNVKHYGKAEQTHKSDAKSIVAIRAIREK